MSRRLVNLTLDTLSELPHSCRRCVFWELDPAAAQDVCLQGDPGLEKEAWVSQTLLEWGACGKLAYVADAPAGYVMYAPPQYVPRAATLPTGPASADAVLLTTARVLPEYAGSGLGRMLVREAARDVARRGIRAIEVFGDARFGEPDPAGASGTAGRASAPAVRGCMGPAEFFLAVGFKTVRPHERYPRLRLDLRTGPSLKSDVEYELDALLEWVSPQWVPGSAPRPSSYLSTPS